MIEKSISYVNDDGAEVWYLRSKGKRYIHRLNGPAIITSDGSKGWVVHNSYHRLDGPAVIFSEANKHFSRLRRHWFIDGKQLNGELVEKWIKENSIDLSTEEGQVALKLRWL